MRRESEEPRPKRPRPAISRLLEDGTIVEMVYRPEEHRTAFVVAKDYGWEVEAGITLPSGLQLVPYAPTNSLLEHEVVLLPSGPEEYGSAENLVADVRAYIHRYVDVGSLFEELSAYYVLFTWIYDAFNELPYLRVMGDYGSGKSRFLLTVGSVCYKPIFASGASTVSPIFRILDAFRGTLVIDEGDFRVSDEKAEIVKILNNGNARGFPVLRSEVLQTKEINPQAFAVFGPKLVATRGLFEDRALESRCISEEMGTARPRSDIPLNMPARQKEEALQLRNKLLLFRIRNLATPRDLAAGVDPTLEPRLNQIFTPLLATIADPATRASLKELARRYGRQAVVDRGLDTEALLLEVIRDLQAAGAELSVKEIASWFADRHAGDYQRAITPKWIGSLLRSRLHLKSEKRHGSYVIAATERAKLDRLFEKYGTMGDIKEVGDVAESTPVPKITLW